MGVRASLTEIRPEEFDCLVTGGDLKRPDAKTHSLDRVWGELHSVLSTQGVPLIFAIPGDHHSPSCPHTFDEFWTGDQEYYAGLVSPQLVRTIAEVLSEFSVEEYERRHHELHGKEKCHGEKYLQSLKEGYSSAAAQGNALMVLIF